MSTLIKTLMANDVEGWHSSAIVTHSDEGLIEMIGAWISAKKKLKNLIIREEIDLAHIHVTHSMSWWRKRSLMRICSKNGIPAVIHIHSGKFDDFCRGVAGKSVKRELAVSGRATVVLEKRWLLKLKKWVPKNTQVVRNTSNFVFSGKEEISFDSPVRFLIMSRDDYVKGHDFAIKVVEILRKRGIESELSITGSNGMDDHKHGGWIKFLGWLSEERKVEVLQESDIMLSPSHFEGSSISVIESLVNGKLCICSPTSAETVGIEELVVDSLDATKWADRIEEIIGRDENQELASKIEIQAQKYNPEDVMKKWKEVYSELLRSKDK